VSRLLTGTLLMRVKKEALVWYSGLLLITFALVWCIFAWPVPGPFGDDPVMMRDEGPHCGLHGKRLAVIRGYSLNGTAHFLGQAEMAYAAARYPNASSPYFSKTLKPHFEERAKEMVCSECETGYERLMGMPDWYKKIVGKPNEWIAKIKTI
ncbi:MAG: hypothetical protein AAF226_19475, partial [Verrucomicrobiota bacterium]